LEEAHRRITLIENRLRQERRIEATIHPEPLSNDN
jgi:divalent metal cation (Fe/Co/Zn/Cd) transporter